MDLKEIHERRNGRFPEELLILYPDARDQFNNALSSVESSYSDEWSGIAVASYQGSLDSWKDAEIPGYQKFFLLLT